MFEQLKSKTAIATAASLIAALGVGGVAVAQNSGNATPAHKANPVTQVQGQQTKAQDSSAADSDNVQSGDQSAPDKGSAQEPAGTETNDASGEQPGTETNDTSGEQSGSEVSNSDGPGGHADEPGNAIADHQAQGQE
jgi:hypothetical protein